MKPDPKTVVVGSGVAGLLSAMIAARNGESAVIIDKSNEPGGLLKSIRGPGDHWFDLGTHLLEETGNHEIDHILWGDLHASDYHILGSARGGNYLGKLNTKSAFPDMRFLPDPIYCRGMVEMIQANPEKKSPENLFDQLTGLYGPTLCEHALFPVLHKFLGADLRQLAPDSHNLFGLRRIIALSSEATNRLKALPELDAKIAWHDDRTFQRPTKSFYPATGGAGQWVNRLVAELKRLNVEILTGKQITSIDSTSGRVTAVELDDGLQIGCRNLIWAAPVAFLLRAMKQSAPLRSGPPTMLSTTLFHYDLDRRYIPDLHYVYFFDPSVQSFRATLYDNFRPGTTEGHHPITVEVIRQSGSGQTCSKEQVFEELKTTGLIPPKSSYHGVMEQDLPAGFPLPTCDIVESGRRQTEQIDNQFENITLVSRSSGGSFFMSDVIADTWEKVTRLFRRD